MKKIACLILLVYVVASLKTYAQEADKILGKWIVGEEKNIVEIFKNDGLYYAKIIEAKNKTNLHAETIILKNFAYDEKSNKWINGRVFAPRKQKEFAGELKLIDINKLEVKVKYGLFSKEIIWIRKS